MPANRGVDTDTDTKSDIESLRAAYNNVLRILDFIPSVRIRPRDVTHFVRIFDFSIRNNLYVLLNDAHQSKPGVSKLLCSRAT